jgi:hypothetical protein
MSQYYTINDLKVRVSDHEPNHAADRLRGRNDIELYVRSIDGKLLSVADQLEAICERRDLNIADFAQVLNDWQDGSYDVNVFAPKKEEEQVAVNSSSIEALRAASHNNNAAALAGYSLQGSWSNAAFRAEVKAVSEATGVSQAFIKRHFNIR